MVCIPGLSGDSNEIYCTYVAKQCRERDLDFVVINYRGTSGVPIKTARVYNSGDTRDMTEVIDYIYAEHCLDEHKNQIRRLTSVGISLGASMLANYAARLGKSNPLDAHVGICCHFDSNVAFQHMQTHFFGMFDYILGTTLLHYNKESYTKFDEIISKTNPEKQVNHLVRKSWTLTKDCGVIVAQAGGYRNAEHY